MDGSGKPIGWLAIAVGALLPAFAGAVDDRDYHQPPFAFDGTIEKLTITIDRPRLSPEDIAKLEAAMAGASNRASK
jgi:hypothetical protein